MKELYEIIQPEDSEESIITWKDMKKRSSIYIKRFNQKSYREIKFVDKHILLCFFGDIHIGNDGTDYTKAEIDARLVSGCEYAVAIQTGDSIDNFIKMSITEAVINQTVSPKQQLSLLQEYIDMFNGKIMIMISGNHERWTKEISGLDFLSNLAKRNNIQYGPDMFLFDVIFNEVKYTIHIRHKSRFNSSYNHTHVVKQMWRMGDYDFDIGVVGHHHQPHLENCYIQNKHIIAIRPGSYKIADTYGRKEGFSQARDNMPCVVLNPNKKEMTGFFNLEDGIKYVNFRNS